MTAIEPIEGPDKSLPDDALADAAGAGLGDWVKTIIGTDQDHHLHP